MAYDFNPKDLDINKFDLDNECARQGSLYFLWSKRLAERTDELERKNRELSLYVAELEADVNSDIRNNPERYGIEKLREADIGTKLKVAILKNPVRIRLENEYLDLKKEVAILSGAVKALSHKNDNLNNEVKLWGGKYWTEPETEVLRQKLAEKHRQEILKKEW